MWNILDYSRSVIYDNSCQELDLDKGWFLHNAVVIVVIVVTVTVTSSGPYSSQGPQEKKKRENQPLNNRGAILQADICGCVSEHVALYCWCLFLFSRQF